MPRKNSIKTVTISTRVPEYVKEHLYTNVDKRKRSEWLLSAIIEKWARDEK